MKSKAMASVFWLSLSWDIDSTGQNCEQCCRTAPSQQSASPFPVTMAEFPFQCSNMNSSPSRRTTTSWLLRGNPNCPTIEKANGGAAGLINIYVESSLWQTRFLEMEDRSLLHTKQKTSSWPGTWITECLPWLSFSQILEQIYVPKTAKRLITKA